MARSHFLFVLMIVCISALFARHEIVRIGAVKPNIVLALFAVLPCIGMSTVRVVILMLSASVFLVFGTPWLSLLLLLVCGGLFILCASRMPGTPLVNSVLCAFVGAFVFLLASSWSFVVRSPILALLDVFFTILATACLYYGITFFLYEKEQ